MPFAQVQKATQNDVVNTTTSHARALTSNPGKGNLIIRCGAVFDDGGATLDIDRIEDANGDRFRVVKAFGDISGVRGIAYLGYRWGSDSSVNAKTVTTYVSGRLGNLYWAGQGLMEYSGVDIGDVLEASQSIATVNTASVDVGYAATGTLSQATCLGVAQMMLAGVSANEHIVAPTQPSAWTLEYAQQDSLTYVGAGTGTKILTANTGFTPTWSHDNAATTIGSGVMLLLRAAAAAAAGSGRRRGSMNAGML